MEPRSIYLIFEDGDLSICKYLKKGFGHVSILVCDGFNWVFFNPSKSHFEWEIMPLMPTDDPFKDYFKSATLVKIDDIVTTNRWVGKIGFMSCVLLAKYFLGIRSLSITPYQLYKYVIKKELGAHHGA